MTKYSLTLSTSTVAYPLPSIRLGHAARGGGHHPRRMVVLRPPSFSEECSTQRRVVGWGRGSSCSTTVILYGINLFLSYFTQFVI